MSNSRINPFNITKAVDFTDGDINRYWVDISSHDGFLHMLRPHSLMPMFILGGKGSGKTHVMRYFSYPVRKKRHVISLEDIKNDGFIGIYFRCGGLNASRFDGRGVSSQNWEMVFPYYMDLWIAQLVLKTIADAFSGLDELSDNEEEICSDIINVFDQWDSGKCHNISSLLSAIRDLQREVDIAVNNLLTNPDLQVPIRTTPGRLVFKVPEILVQHLPSLSDVKFLYLIDEFENLNGMHQKYVNSIVREREGPSSFRVGSRLYGVKTSATYSAGEINRDGAEFESLNLDAQLRVSDGERQYIEFAQNLCFNRLQKAGFISKDKLQTHEDLLQGYFELFEKSKFSDSETEFIIKKYGGKERPYFSKLKKKLAQGIEAKCISGVPTQTEINKLIQNLSVERSPLLEKVNIFLLYRAWSKGNINLVDYSKVIKRECQSLIDAGFSDSGEHKKVLSKFKEDLLAQLFRECGKKQRYIGLDIFIKMSAALPRHLLVILKHIYDWSSFNGENPFCDSNKISIKSQRNGILDASEWFYNDARAVGDYGQLIIAAIGRLATFFKDMRFSDKPSECSLVTFSVDPNTLSEEAKKIIELAEKWSLLIKIPGGQHNKNSMRVDDKFQLNPMLAPRWDLPVARRGAISLNTLEANAIFDSKCAGNFEEVKKGRVNRMTAPFFGKSPAISGKQAELL